MRYPITLLLIFVSLLSHSQREQEIDSLKSLLNRDDVNEKQISLNLQISKLLENRYRDSSKIYARKAETLAQKINHKQLLQKSFLQQGILAYKGKKDAEALQFFSKIDSLQGLLDSFDETYIMTKIYRSEISKFTFTPSGIKEAKDFLLEGRALSEQIKDQELIHLFLFRLGNWHGFMSQAEHTKEHLDSAKMYVNSALKYYSDTDDFENISKAYYTLASIEMSKGNQSKADFYYQQRLNAVKKTNDSLSIGEAYFGMASINKTFNKPDEGLKYLDSAAAIFKNFGFSSDQRKKNFYRDYAYMYELKKDYKNAFLNMQKAIVYKDTLYQEENNRIALDLQTKYQTEKKEQEIALLKSQNEIEQQKQKNQRNILLAGLSFTSLAGIFLFVLYRNRRKTNKKLKELDSIKSNFFANISHEFRTPLTLINSPIESALQDGTLPEHKKQQFAIAKYNSDRLLELVNQLLDLSKIDAGQLKLHLQKGNALHLMSALADAFQYQAQEKQINYFISVDHSDNKVWYDRDALEKITVNLLSNAIKYTPQNGTVNFTASINNSTLTLEVKNTGEVLSGEEMDTIFQRFYQTNAQNQGTGIGLALVKELVELHKGTIAVESSEESGTQFTVSLPIDKYRFKNDVFIETSNDDMEISVPNGSNYISDEEAEVFEDNEKPILLIAEDHADLRTLLKNTFEENYNIITCENGNEGVDLALEHIPDVIISDVMMPHKNGIELTQILKKDERTSHIPIVLLTAKAGDENRLLGLEVGADDYMTKPFNTKILITKVNQLLESRQLLQQRYSQELVLMPKDIAITDLDEQFLDKIQQILEEKLVESCFSVNDFSDAVGMSRMQLHRKLKALTGLSATEFIRSQRLKLAAHLLKSSDINISQVGYSVGFNDHSYFAKCFKEAYNCTPTEYAKRK